MKKGLQAVVVAMIAVVATVLAGCSTPPANGAPHDDTLRIGNFQDVTSWNPADADIGFDGPYLSAVYDGLVSLDKESDPVPALATSWKYSADRLTLTMHLRKGVSFSDGEPFDAKAAVVNLNSLMHGTRSAPTYRNVKSVSLVDPSTIQLHLTHRDDALLYFMGLGRSWMAAPKAIKSGKIVSHPVGTGAYTLKSSASRKGAKYVFVKKKHYWDPEQYPFPKVEVFPINNATASYDAMLSGQINVQYGNAFNIPRAKDYGWNIAKKPSMWIGIQFADRAGKVLPALRKQKVRQAISYAFNTKGILQLGGGTSAGTATDQLFPVGGAVHDPGLDSRYSHNMAKARKLLAEAGYPHGFSVTMPMSPAYLGWEPAATQTFERLGIDVSWKNMTYAEYFMKAPSFPMYISAISMDSNPMATLADQLTTPQWYNPNPGLDSYPEVKRMVAKVEAARGKEQLKLLRKLNSMLVEKAWWDVWMQTDNVFFSTAGIKVTPITGMMFPTLKFIQPTSR